MTLKSVSSSTMTAPLYAMNSLYERDPLVGQLGEVLERAAVVEVGDGDVEADVDHRLAAVDLLVVRLERLPERHPRSLDAEVDESRGAAERGRDRRRT